MSAFYVTALFCGLIIFHAQQAMAVEPWQLLEVRYCGPPKRNADGVIIRSAAVRSAFQKLEPCPANGSREGPCPGWQVQHDRPLACGGCDAVFNMSWAPLQIKTCREWWCLDRFERLIYGGHVEGTSCGVPPLKIPEG